jgi:uncharacterized protein YaaR (DUF327 family)
MKIRESVDRASAMVPVLTNTEKKVKNARNTSFQSYYRDAEGENCKEKLVSLMKDIGEQGEILKKRLDIKELMRYKKMISEFLNEAVKNSHEFSKDSSLDRRGRHRVWASIKQVNDELDELTKEVLSEEKDHLRIIEKMEGIQGLLLDIIL